MSEPRNIDYDADESDDEELTGERMTCVMCGGVVMCSVHLAGEYSHVTMQLCCVVLCVVCVAV